MAAPTFVASASNAQATAGTGPLTTTKPTGTANGDLVLIYVAMASGTGATPTTPSGGFTVLAIQGASYLYGKIASSEPASYDV